MNTIQNPRTKAGRIEATRNKINQLTEKFGFTHQKVLALRISLYNLKNS
jgi:hypothetical protein